MISPLVMRERYGFETFRCSCCGDELRARCELHRRSARRTRQRRPRQQPRQPGEPHAEPGREVLRRRDPAGRRFERRDQSVLDRRRQRGRRVGAAMQNLQPQLALAAITEYASSVNATSTHARRGRAPRIPRPLPKRAPRFTSLPRTRRNCVHAPRRSCRRRRSGSPRSSRRCRSSAVTRSSRASQCRWPRLATTDVGRLAYASDGGGVRRRPRRDDGARARAGRRADDRDRRGLGHRRE